MARRKEVEPQLPPESTEVASMREMYGEPSALTCPECGGALWEIQESRVVRYQCHTGHQFAPDSLQSEQRDAVDGALWSAVRVLEEHAELKMRMARRALDGGLTKESAGLVAEELRKLIQQPGSDRDRTGLLHEIQVYQEELTVQNKALRDMQTALEETRDRFVELYDFAPNGYVTLDPQGIIQQINLTGAAWLGKSKQALEGMPFLGFIDSGDRDGWMDYLRRCRDYKMGKAVSIQLRLRGIDGHRVIELLCKPRQQSSPEYLTTMIDLTEHLQLQAEREEAAHARAALAGRLISIQEDERIRIARDLHDNLGQQLTGLRLRLEAIALTESVDANFSRHVHEAQMLIDKVDRGLDFIAAELRPALLDVDFVSALREFLNEWSITFGIEATFHASPLPDINLGEDTRTNLYRITQEALNNVYRHAQARRVSVILERRRDSLVLLIEDDGKGFEYTGKERRGRHGLGLVGMRERAALIGGKLEVESAPGKGTTVFVTVIGAFDRSRNNPAAANR